MRVHLLHTGAALAAILTVACGDDSRPAGPRFDAVAAGSISGALLGPDSTSLCHAFPDGTYLILRALNPPPASPSFAGSQFVYCPDSTYSIDVPAGTYYLRMTLPFDPSIGMMPTRYLVPTPVTVQGGDVRQDIRVRAGTGLAGGATFDGTPFPGVALGLEYDQLPGYAAASGTSGPDGGWVEDLVGREPMVLQNDLRYQAPAPICDALGTKVVQGPPVGGFLFPSPVNEVDCALTAAPNAAFSHDRTRLVVTPMPGDIGGLSPELAGRFGEGWGVQFPVVVGQSPQRGNSAISQLFRGGLIIGLRPDRVLTGFDMTGYGDCAPSCRDLGLDGKMTYAASPRFGKKVLWHYSDATSAEGVGLKVLQKSYDGGPPNDYVLFHFIFTNSSAAPITFYAGMFADWDIGDDPSDDVGFTAMDGRLMYMTDAGGGGVYAGTLLLGDAPVSGDAVLTDFGQSTAEQVALLAGDETAPSATDPNDHRYIHARGPFVLQPGASGSLWIAMVAGETQDQLFTNANAASADVARRGADAGDSVPAGSAVVLAGVSSSNRALNPHCKRGCVRP